LSKFISEKEENKKLMSIPEKYQITETITQDTYLVDGELKKWTGQTSEVYSTISSTVKRSSFRI